MDKRSISALIATATVRWEVSLAEATEVVMKLDADLNGKLSLDEFMAWWEVGLSLDDQKAEAMRLDRIAAQASLLEASQQTQPSMDAKEDEDEAEETAAVEYKVGDRVHHKYRGGGTVTELMEDGRTRVAFDSGEEHR